jgi:hypothetical protein
MQIRGCHNPIQLNKQEQQRKTKKYEFQHSMLFIDQHVLYTLHQYYNN